MANMVEQYRVKWSKTEVKGFDILKNVLMVLLVLFLGVSAIMWVMLPYTIEAMSNKMDEIIKLLEKGNK